MAVSLAQVVGLAELELQVRTTTPSLDRPLRWVASSELLDPTPWIEAGDLVLTTGMVMSGEAEESRAYVRRLADVQAAGLGFGVGVHHADVPAVLLAAAEELGLPVIEVPAPLPFVAVSRAVSRLQAAEEYAESGAAFDSQRRMIRQVLAVQSADPAGQSSPGDAVVTVLSRHIRGFALHLGPTGEVLSAFPEAAAEKAGELAPEIDRLRPRGLLASASISSAQEHIVIVPVGIRESVRGFVVAGATSALTSADQAVLNLAVSLLAWSGSQGPALERRLDPWRALLLDHGRVTGFSAEQLASVGLGHVDPRSAVGVCARPAPGRSGLRGVLEGIEAGGDALLCEDAGGGLVGIAARPDADGVPGIVRSIAQAESVLSVGFSEVLDLTESATVRQALEQASQAARSGPGIRPFAEVGARSLGALVDAAVAGEWARGYLAPLAAVPEGHELRETLHAWLASHGQADATAQRLGIHRHTVRHRLRRAEAVLGMSLDDPEVRANLWFALSSTTDAVPAAQ